MILDAIFTVFFAIAGLILSLIPELKFFDLFYLDLAAVWAPVTIVFDFFPYDLFMLCLESKFFWMTFDFAWNIIKWLYKKLPGVD